MLAASAFSSGVPASAAALFASTRFPPAVRNRTCRSPPVTRKTMDLTIWSMPQPQVRAASSAVRVPAASSSTSMSRPRAAASAMTRATEPPAGADASASFDVDIIAVGRTGIELARPADLLLRVVEHFLPLGDPADRARKRKDRREHRGGETHRVEND